MYLLTKPIFDFQKIGNITGFYLLIHSLIETKLF